MSLTPTQGAVVKPITIDQLYNEALALAEESRAYFAQYSKTDRAALEPIDRVVYTAESLRISTRLMHVISWTLVRKAVANGEISHEESLASKHQLDDVDLCRGSDPRALRKMPRSVVVLTHQSLKIFQRALRMQKQILAVDTDVQSPAANPVASMIRELELAI